MATRLGEVIASGVADLFDRVETERKLRDVWQWLPDEVSEFPIEAGSDMTVTVAGPDSPYQPVNRLELLLRRTNTVRVLRPEIALMEPCLDVLQRLIDDGVAVTLVDRPNCHAYFLSTYPERSSELLEQDNFSVLEHEELPSYGVGLLDDRVAISCYEQDSWAVQAVIDTDESVVREWAESVYATYRSGARPIES